MCICPRCGNQLRRLARKGFLQHAFYPLFGYYPWECFACRTKRLLRLRGRRVFHRIWDEAVDELDNRLDESDPEAGVPESVPSSGGDSSQETGCSQAVPPGVA